MFKRSDARVAIVAVPFTGVDAVAVLVAREADVRADVGGDVAVIHRALVAVVTVRLGARNARHADRIAPLVTVAQDPVAAVAAADRGVHAVSSVPRSAPVGAARVHGWRAWLFGLVQLRACAAP